MLGSPRCRLQPKTGRWMSLGSGPIQSHLLTRLDISLGWGEGFCLSQPLVFVLVNSTLTQSSHCTDWCSERGRVLPKVTQQIDSRVETRTQVSCLSAQPWHWPETGPCRGGQFPLGCPHSPSWSLEFC